MFLSGGDRDLGVALQTHPGRQAFMPPLKTNPKYLISSLQICAFFLDTRDPASARKWRSLGSLHSILPRSQQLATRRPHIAGDNIHTFQAGKAPGLRPRLLQRCLVCFESLREVCPSELLLIASDWVVPFKGKNGL